MVGMAETISKNTILVLTIVAIVISIISITLSIVTINKFPVVQPSDGSQVQPIPGGRVNAQVPPQPERTGALVQATVEGGT